MQALINDLRRLYALFGLGRPRPSTSITQSPAAPVAMVTAIAPDPARKLSFNAWIRERGLYDEVIEALRDGITANEIYRALEADGVPLLRSSFTEWCHEERKKLGINRRSMQRKAKVAA